MAPKAALRPFQIRALCSGEVLASFKARGPVTCTPAVLRGERGKQSIIIFGTDDGEVIAMDTQERALWTFQTQGRVTAEPAIIRTKTEALVVVGSWDGTLYALRPSGELVWRFKTEGAISSKAQIVDVNGDGVAEIVFGSCDNKVYALSLKGERLWTYETDFWVVASPLVAAMGTLRSLRAATTITCTCLKERARTISTSCRGSRDSCSRAAIIQTS